MPLCRQNNVHALARVFLLATLALAVGRTEAAPVAALLPLAARVIVLANRDDPESMALARYYAERRGIPTANLYSYPMAGAETISWPEFIATIWQPLQDDLVRAGWIDAIPTQLTDAAGRRKYIIHRHRLSYLVVCRGVPLRIAHNPSWAIEPPVLPLAGRTEFLTNQAAVDSELALLAQSLHPTGRFIPSPLFHNATPTAYDEERVVKTSRLDGPTAADARALIDHALAAERDGLAGRAYVDLGGIHADGDRWLEETARILDEAGYDSAVDRTPTTLAGAARGDGAAWYFGWYTGDLNGPFALPGYRFPPGAVALHIHSASAQTLRSVQQGWTGPLVARGVTATFGNVYEPYLQLTHRPHLVARALLRGATLGDAAYYALPALSWQSIVIGDPLYRPMAVPLTQQWERRGKLSVKLAGYIAVRKMRLLEMESREDESLALGTTELAERPSLPLALAIAERCTQRGDTAAALRTLGVAAQHLSFAPDEWALVRTLAQQLHTVGASSQAVAVYRQLLAVRELPRELRLVWLAEAQQVAETAHDHEQFAKWKRELTELRPALSP